MNYKIFIFILKIKKKIINTDARPNYLGPNYRFATY